MIQKGEDFKKKARVARHPHLWRIQMVLVEKRCIWLLCGDLQKALCKTTDSSIRKEECSI